VAAFMAILVGEMAEAPPFLHTPPISA